MREILFRGKRVDNGEWFFGNLDLRQFGGSFYACIIHQLSMWKTTKFEVIPETVGEYTGLTDKNGKKIFEGDIIRSNSERGYIEYYPNDCAFDVVDDHGFYWLISEMSNIEVIGNIHDNPELLEAEK